MPRQFISNYATELKDFIDLKRSDGFIYENTSKLYEFDLFLHTKKVSSKGLPRRIWEQWSITKPGETDSTRYDKMCFLAQFSEYLNAIGKTSFMMRRPKRPPDDYIPYIYSPKEIKAIFKACDEFTLTAKKWDCSIICIPAIVRLLYSTGLRLEEAQSLRNNDVNLNDKFLIVRESKNRQERIIPISTSLLQVFQEYLKYKKALLGERERGDYFFLKLNGKKICQGVQSYFKKCLHNARVRDKGQKKGPRLHDLRHTFAIRAFKKMENSGINFFSALPTLSIYLGHRSLASTVYYLKLTAARFPEIIKKLEKAYPNIIPILDDNYDN